MRIHLRLRQSRRFAWSGWVREQLHWEHRYIGASRAGLPCAVDAFLLRANDLWLLPNGCTRRDVGAHIPLSDERYRSDLTMLAVE